MLPLHVLDVTQPVVRHADAAPVQGVLHAAAAVVAHDDDVLHPQQVDREVDDGEAVEIGMDDDIADVAVDEHFARREAGDLIGRHPAVRAADPEVLGRLLLQQPLEIGGIPPGLELGPPAVVLDQTLERFGHEELRREGQARAGKRTISQSGRPDRRAVRPGLARNRRVTPRGGAVKSRLPRSRKGVES